MSNLVVSIKKPGFSLIEVLFAITFFIMVGIALISLNVAASRLITAAEFKVTALDLNQRSISYVAAEISSKGLTTFLDGKTLGTEYYVDCVNGCRLSAVKSVTQYGLSKIQYVPTVVITEPANQVRTPKYLLVTATTTWGRGTANRLVTNQLLEQ